MKLIYFINYYLYFILLFFSYNSLIKNFKINFINLGVIITTRLLVNKDSIIVWNNDSKKVIDHENDKKETH